MERRVRRVQHESNVKKTAVVLQFVSFRCHMTRSVFRMTRFVSA